MGAFQIQSLTANRLTDGAVIYWRGGAWIEGFAQADVFTDKMAADAVLAEAQVFVKQRVVVNPYLFPVRADEDGLHAVEEREIVRSEGPSVRRDLGKQAEPSMDSFDVSL